MIVNNINSLIPKIEPFNILHKTNICCIPDWQRGYEWEPEYIDGFLDEISEVINSTNLNKSIFFGSIVYYSDDNFVFNIADGQQRLTSFILFIKVLNEYINEHKLLDLEPIPEISIKYIDKASQESYNEFIEKAKKESTYKKMYTHIKDFIEYNSENIDKIYTIMENNVYGNYLQMPDEEMAYRYFEECNTGRKDLNKNTVLASSIKIYNKKLATPIDIHCDSKSIYKNVQKYIVEKELKYNLNSITALKTLKYLKANIISSKDNLMEFAIFNAFLNNYKDSAIGDICALANRQQINTIVTHYQRKGLDLNSFQLPEIKQVIFPLIFISICCTLGKKNPGGILKEFFDDCAQKVLYDTNYWEINKYIINFIEQNPSLFMTPNTFLNELRNKKNWQMAKLVLLLILLLKNVNGFPPIHNLDLEHVCPQEITEWKQHGYTKPHFKDDGELEKYQHSIGNMILLNSKINKKIQNSFITEKNKYYLDSYSQNAALNYELNTMNVEACKDPELYKEEVKRREKEILAFIKNNFPLAQNIFLPEVIIND